jgi:hypothetical protein
MEFACTKDLSIGNLLLISALAWVVLLRRISIHKEMSVENVLMEGP